MIIDDVKITNNNRIKVIRICDECGKKEKAFLSNVWQGKTERVIKIIVKNAVINIGN